VGELRCRIVVVMITGIPQAKRYFLCPLKNLNGEKDPDGKLLEVGGVGIMDEAGRFIEDKQVAAVMGYEVDGCTLFVAFDELECIDIINKATHNYDAKVSASLNDRKNG